MITWTREAADRRLLISKAPSGRPPPCCGTTLKDCALTETPAAPHIVGETEFRGLPMAQSKTMEHATLAPESLPVSKEVLEVRQAPGGHWVGDGFPVRTIFAYDNAEAVSPFLLLDYAGPHHFAPSQQRRGVGEHPHRGFETVTVVYAGEVEHRDSSGGGGKIGAGDVQWMTAGSGVIHEEFHGREFARRGGMFEMVQLWVNLPAKDKLAPPRYQSI